MWQLVINGPGYFDTAYDLPEGVTTLGRADENDVVLSGDLVSRRHARVHRNGDVVRFEDLGSRNGSRLNGSAVTGTVDLAPGDVVSVGENSLALRLPAQSETADTDVMELGGAGVRRFGQGMDIGSAVILAKDMRESVVLRVLDNVGNFEPTNAPVSSEESIVATAAAPISYDSLLLLYRAAEKLATATTLQAFLEETVDRVLERVNATTAVVLLRHSSGVLVPAAVRHRGQLAAGEVPVSDAIIEAALEKGAAIAVANVQDDQRFAQRESVIMYGVDQVLCVPIGSQPPFVGVLYLNKTGESPGMVEPLLDLCTAVSHLVSVAVQKFDGSVDRSHEERVRRVLERFHPPEVAERRAGELREKGRYTELAEGICTVLFCELHGLSAMAHKLPPDKLRELLGEFHQRAMGVVFSFEGTVVRFTDDGVVAIFGAPQSKGDDALRAVRCALALRAEWAKQNGKRQLKERCDLRMALNTGRLVAGTIGHDVRLEFVVIGDPAGIAQALCSSASPKQVLVTGKTLAAIGARFDVTPLGERPIFGKAGVAVFEVLEEDVGVNTSPGVVKP